MTLAAIGSFSDLIEVTVTSISILGGIMAFYSGLEARRSIRIDASSELIALRINHGIARGFDLGLPTALLVAIFLIV